VKGETILEAFPWDATPSYAHSGEDIIARLLLGTNTKPTYLDIGACRPIAGNNTYLFYAAGGRGVLVEPNVSLIPELKAKRPGDIVLNVGIGVTDQIEANYFCYSDPGFNTFNERSVEQRIASSGVKFTQVVKMPLVSINRVIDEHLNGRAPDFLSIDVEGLDLPILRTLDFQRFRPRVICAETIDEDFRRAVPIMAPDVTEFLAEQEYAARAMTYLNTIYVDRSMLS
jgi:FkbM family methyltransferase